MRRSLAPVAVMVLGIGIGAVAGCGKPVLRIADASLGDYFTAEEYKKLREEDRLEYCQELAEQDSIYRAEIADARSAVDRYAGRANAAGAVADSLGRMADSLEARVADLATGAPPRVATGRERAPGSAPSSPTADGASITVESGDSLWRIAAREAIYGDGRRWNELYQANRDRIRDADRIYPGQELVVPR